MPRYLLEISYDGTAYAGWQVQPHSISIQGLIEKALAKFLKGATRLIGAGRTDAGVHALGQKAHFTCSEKVSLHTLVRALNAMLPFDIRILSACEVEETFHAQLSATRKEYHYHISLTPTVSPFLRLYRHHVPWPLCRSLLEKGAARFIGTHDFGSFANLGSKVVSTVRTLYRLEILEQEGGLRLEVEGNGFLYKMVRNITGTLLEVGAKKRSLESLDHLFTHPHRSFGGAAAPAKGLFLVKVTY